MEGQSKADFVREVARAHLEKLEGTLTVSSGSAQRHFHFQGGAPIHLESERAKDSMSAVLVSAGLLTDFDLGKAIRARDSSERMQDSLIRVAKVDPAELARRIQRWLMSALAAPLAWTRSETVFRRERLPVSVVAQSVFVDVPVMEALWRGVGRHLDERELIPLLETGGEDPLRATGHLDQVLEQLTLGRHYAGLRDLLQDGATLEQIRAEVKDRSDTPDRLVWFLRVARAVERGRPPTLSAIKAPQGRSASGAEGGPGVDELVEAVKRGHRKRMGKNYYAFLGLKPVAPPERVELECRRLLRRWKAVSRKPELPAASRALMDELLGALPLVAKTLTDPRLRAEYDRRVAAGRAPVVGAIRGADASTLGMRKSSAGGRRGAALHEARRLMDAGDFQRATSLLNGLRLRHPSDPDVLAELGWAAYKSGSAGAADAEDYLQLAVTFDGDHFRALAALARIAVAEKDLPAARKRLRAVLRRDPGATWAREALSKLPAE